MKSESYKIINKILIFRYYNYVLISIYFSYCSHATTKLLTGAGVWALGKVTGNQQLQATGKGLKTLGAATLIGSHFLPQGRR